MKDSNNMLIYYCTLATPKSVINRDHSFFMTWDVTFPEKLPLNLPAHGPTQADNRHPQESLLHLCVHIVRHGHRHGYKWSTVVVHSNVRQTYW